MLRSLNEMRGYVVRTTNGAIGRCQDFLFDDRYWTVRHMVIDLGTWLPGRRVLISPVWLEEPDRQSRTLFVGLTRERVENAPELDDDPPVSRRHQNASRRSNAAFVCWNGLTAWETMICPPVRTVQHTIDREDKTEQAPEECHLRSANEMTRYRIRATDGRLGHIAEFLVEDMTWSIRHIVVDTGYLWSGKRVLTDPEWVSDVNWHTREVAVYVAVNAIADGSEYRSFITAGRK